MILRNSCPNEFTPGCEWTVVDIDAGLIRVIEQRGRAFREVQAKDDSLWQARYWDSRPVCFNSSEALDALVPEVSGMDFDGWNEDSGGWVVLGDLVIPDGQIVSTDLRTMTIGTEGDDIEVGWVFNLKDCAEVIRTAVVNLSELTRRLDVHHPGLPSSPADRSTRRR